MEQLLITSFQKEDFEELIMTCLKRVLKDFELGNIQQEKINEEILSTDDLQKMFKVSKVTIHKWKKKGLIPYYKMNRKVYFKRSEIIESLAQRKRKLEI
ncbi:MAG: helix-turn-helix domain-containing protein [Bacteroidales bacterium]|nr:helix-turn-helix domain-containing protein [Bacteroidales bacterium]